MTTAIAIAASATTAILSAAIIVLVLKLTAVAPTLVEYGEAQVQAALNQHTAEDERDQEKALREQTEAELKDALAKLAAAEKALAACGAKEVQRVETTIATAGIPDSAFNDELRAPVPAGGPAPAAGADHGQAGDPAVRTAGPAAGAVRGSAPR